MIASITKRWWYLIILAVLVARARESARDGAWFSLTVILLGALGVAMNVLVIILNDGMPARARIEEISAEERANYKPIDASTRLPLLADWISFRDYLISPGDILIAVAIVGVLFRAPWR